MIKKIKDLLAIFSLKNENFKYSTLHSGYINKTYLIELAFPEGKKIILQNLNSIALTDVYTMSINTMVVCEHIEKRLNVATAPKDYINLNFHNNKEGDFAKVLYTDIDGQYWRIMDYIENKSFGSDKVTENIAAEAGRVLGRFHQLMEDCDPVKIIEFLPNFHRCDLRFQKFKKIELENNKRYEDTKEFYDKIIEFEYLVDKFITIVNQDELPLRIAHNDPKLSNVLFDESGKGLTMIDLDTVMPGYWNSDFGDAIRSIANTADENELDLANVDFNFLIFKRFTSAYLTTVRDSITKKEKEYLAFFALLITFEQLIRFYGDFLENDIYYQTEYPLHNWNRSQVQMKLLQAMADRFEEMEAFVMGVK